MKKTVAIILARGGSKGIPHKNIIKFCGKPLITWSILQAKAVKDISDVWVSSDDEKILKIAKMNDAKIIRRPKRLATSIANHDEGFLHAINYIQTNFYKIDIVVALQATSPIRESSDISKAVKKFKIKKLDTMFSACLTGDMLIWRKKGKKLHSLNYDYKKRPSRQEFGNDFIENGSFYIFKPEIIKKYKNRLSGKIGLFVMDSWKLFELDEPDDIKFCEIIMKNYLLKKNYFK